MCVDGEEYMDKYKVFVLDRDIFAEKMRLRHIIHVVCLIKEICAYAVHNSGKYIHFRLVIIVRLTDDTKTHLNIT